MKSFASILFVLFSVSAFGNCSVDKLKIDRRTNPLGFDNPAPELSWIILSKDQGKFQKAFEILVSDDPNKLKAGTGNIWSSGRIESSQTFGIHYKGGPFASFTRYYWKVRVWDQNGAESEWSDPAWFETAVMNSGDWKAKWITNQRPLPVKDEDFYKDIPNPLLRKEISIKKEVRTARLYMAGLGYSVAYMNGRRIGDLMLDMPWTQFANQVMYNTFDVTSLLHKGKNALGVMLGNGWYNPLPIKMFQRWNFRDYLTVGKPCLKAQLRITYTDGTIETLVTDDSWKTSDGPVLKNSVYLGELYDARLEQKGWNETGFKDSQWKAAQVTEGPGGQLIARYIPPVKVTKILKPVKITEPSPGVFLFDFGQNFAGVPRLKVHGPAGSKVILKGGEDIHPDGTLNYLTVIIAQLKSMWNLKGGPGCPDDPININTYILSGNGEEVYTPEFTFSGFRYIEVSGYPGKPDLNSVEGLRMNTDLEVNGNFECSNALFNQIQEATLWTFMSNIFSVQSDCPAREKLGYGADIVTTAEAFCYNFDMSSFYRKVVQDFANDVRSNGGMPEIAPNVGINESGMGGETGSPGWQLAFPYGMKVLHDYYGDRVTLEKHYQLLKSQVDFMHSVTPAHIVQQDIGDHESIDTKPTALSATAFYYHHVIILKEFAELLKRETDILTYGKLAEEIKASIIKTFLKPGTGIFDSGTQGAQVIALNYNLVPDSEKDAAIDRLLREIYIRHKGHLSTGIFGTKFMLNFLREENRNDVAYSMANQRTFPGWGNMLANGATTLYESWKYPDTVGSQNHPMFGSVSEWFYKSLLGINATAPGFTQFEIHPQPAGDLTWAKGYYDAVVGRIISDWHTEGRKFYLTVSIPANTKAVIYVPSLAKLPVAENGGPAELSKGLKFIEYRDDYAVFDADPGDYSFTSTWQK